MSQAQLLLLRQGGASGTLPLEETCFSEEVETMVALARLVPGHLSFIIVFFKTWALLHSCQVLKMCHRDTYHLCIPPPQLFLYRVRFDKN